MMIFVFIIRYGLMSINNISLKTTVTSTDLGVIIGGFSGILSALLIIPKIIAEHLFPKDEDTNMIGMVKNMQLNDTGIRNLLYSQNSKDNEN